MYVLETTNWPQQEVSVRGANGKVYGVFLPGQYGFSQVLTIQGDDPFSEAFEGAAAGAELVVYVGDKPTNTAFDFKIASHLQVLSLKQSKFEETNTIEVFPNPVSEGQAFTVSVRLSHPHPELRIDAIDLLGRTHSLINRADVQPGTLEFEVNSQGLPSGILLLRVFAGDQLIGQRKVVQR